MKNQYTVIEANIKAPYDGVQYRDNNWPQRYDKFKGLRVVNSTVSNRRNASNYAENQLNKPYSIVANRWSEDIWYSSKLVWRAWYEQGYDIEGRTYEPQGTHITPGDILDSPLTEVFHNYIKK